MRRRTLRLIAAKELLDTLRDRRTLFISLVLPLLLYPALLLGLTQVIGVTQRNLAQDRQRVLLDGPDPGGELAKTLAGHHLLPVAVESAGARLHAGLIQGLARMQADGSDRARARLRELLKQKDLSGALICSPGFTKAIHATRQARATLLFDPTDEASKAARGKLQAALAEYEAARRKELRERNPSREQELLFVEDPVKTEPLELASRSQKGAYSFAPLLGMLIVIMALTGAFYPAVDLAAGEKERGTLETLLVAPVTRREIVMGKFLAIWVIAVVTALCNLLVMGLTFSKLAGMLGSSRIAFHLPVSAMAAVTLILIPTAALFSAVALALSSFATSYKEGQHYMTPLYLVVMPLAMVALLPNIELGYGLAMVPVANVVLLVKAMLLGGEAAGPALLATGVMVVYAAAALWAAVAIFRRESVLFRTGAGRGFDPAMLRATREGLPTGGLGVLLFFIVLALLFFLSGRMETTAQAVRSFLIAQLVGILAPTLLLAYRAKLDVRATLGLRGFRPRAIAPVIVAACATLVVVAGLYGLLMPHPARPTGIEKLVAELLGGVSPWLFFCMLAVVPPICEELLCRGFLLASFRTRHGDRLAVIYAAALFAVLHLDLARIPGTFAAGLMLGYVRIRTGSILAAILFHMAYNGVIASTTVSSWMNARMAGLDPTWIAVAALVLTGAILLLERAVRRH